jgi:protein-tyrosine phosphatase
MADRTSRTHPIRVDFAPWPAPPRRLGMTFAPGKIQADGHSGSWNRNLSADLERLRATYETDVLVSLVEDHELAELKIDTLPDVATDIGIEVLRFPIRDVSVPSSHSETRRLVGSILTALGANRVVVVHCKGGLGRSGLVVACVLQQLGASAAEAITAVRAARAGAIETKEQERFVHEFAEGRWK